MGGHLTRLGGPSRWCTILTTTNLHFQRAKPSPLWSGLFLESRIGSRLPQIPPNPLGLSAARRRPRASSPLTARRMDAGGGGLPTICQELGIRFGWGRSLHRHPSVQEGRRSDEEAEADSSTTGGVQCARDADSGSNNPNVVWIETGAVVQHGTGDIQQPAGHRAQSERMSVAAGA